MAGSSKVARNFITTLASQILSWGLTFLVLRYVPGYLGVQGVALISLAGAFSLAMTQWVSLGTNSILIKEIAQQPARTGELLVAAFAMRFLLWMAAVGVGMTVAYALRYDAYQNRLILIVLCLLLVSQINEALASALKGLEDFPRYNLATLTERFAASAIQIVMVHLKAPIWMFALVTGISGLLGLLVALAGLWRHRSVFSGPLRALRPRRETMLFLAQAGFPLMIGMVFIGLWEPGNKILLSKLASQEAVGWFEVAKKLGGTTMFIPATLAGVLLPTLTRLYQSDLAEFATVARRLMRLILLCAIPFAAVLIFAPGRILDLLHYPPEFHGSVPVLQALGAGIILWYLSQAATVTLLAMNQQKIIGKIGMSLAVFCLPTCALCIWVAHRLPMLRNGALGAMVADILIEAWMLRCYARQLPPGILTWREAGVLVRALIAALPLAGLLYAMPSFRQFYYALPGLALFPVLCLALRCVDKSDLEMLGPGLLGRLKRRG